MKVEEAVAEDITKVTEDATKIVSDKIPADKDIVEDRNVTKNITKRETPSLPSGSDKSAMVTPSKVHDVDIGEDAISQRTSEENVQHHSQQPDHLETTKHKATAREAWQGSEAAAKDKAQSTEDKQTVNVKQVDEDLKVEDVEDERQEIMEYVAVLEEEEKEADEEKEEER